MRHAVTTTVQRPQGRGVRELVPEPAYETLFGVIAELRAPAPTHLYDIFFARAFKDPSTGRPIQERRVRRRMGLLVSGGYIASTRISATRYRVVHLAEKGRTAFDSVSAQYGEQVRRRPSDDIAAWGWMRSAMWAALIRDGFRVGRDLRALLALRRNLVDRQRAAVEAAVGPARVQAERTLKQLRAAEVLTPLARPSCSACGYEGSLQDRPATKACPGCGRATYVLKAIERPHVCSVCGYRSDRAELHRVRGSSTTEPCKGRMGPRNYLSFDVAYRRDGEVSQAMLLVVDNPFRSIERQLQELPVRFLGQPRLPVIIRTADDESVWDPNTESWQLKGPRLRQLQRAFNPAARSSGFPYWKTCDLYPYRPDLVFRSLPRRTATDA